jgi:hypothetical protein
MKYSPYLITMGACQLAMFIGVTVFAYNPVLGIFLAIMFTSAVTILQDLPRIVRWSVVVSYLVVFATFALLVLCNTPEVSVADFAAISGLGVSYFVITAWCVFALKGLLNLLVRLANKIPEAIRARRAKAASRFTRLTRRELMPARLKPESKKPGEPIFGPGWPMAVAEMFGQLLMACLRS